MKTIVEKLNALEQETSSNAKIVLLKKYLEDDEFRIVVEMALDETLHYNVAKLMGNVPRKTEPDFYALIDYLHFLAGKTGMNNAEKKELASFAVNDDWETVIIRIIKKDLKCGVGAKLVNKAVPGSIDIMPYMRYNTSKKLANIIFPAFAQIKEDGLFVNIFHNENEIKYLSRSGNEFIFPENSLTELITKHFPTYDTTNVFMGEFRCQIDGKWLPRKTSNGIVNKALKKNQTMSTGESLTVHFICWDVVTATEFWGCQSNTEYDLRFGQIEFLTDVEEERLHLSETRIINSINQGRNWAKELIAAGEEGVILKNFDSDWGHKTSSDGIKLKAGDLGQDEERECELLVVDFYYGKKGTKYENCLGGLVCESSDGLLNTNIGGGFSDQDRGFLGFDENRIPIIQFDIDNWLGDKYISSIITARFNEVIVAKKAKTHSLFSARFVEKREDKKEADTLKYIKDLI